MIQDQFSVGNETLHFKQKTVSVLWRGLDRKGGHTLHVLSAYDIGET